MWRKFALVVLQNLHRNFKEASIIRNPYILIRFGIQYSDYVKNPKTVLHCSVTNIKMILKKYSYQITGSQDTSD